MPVVTVPTTLTAGASYQATWGAVSGATQYVVERSYNGGAYGVVHDGAGTSVSLSAASAGTLSHRAKACNASGCSAYSAVASTTVTSPPPPVPAAPSVTVPGTLATGTQYQATWSAVSGATQYVVERSYNGGAYGVVYDGAGTSASLSAASAGTLSHRARACNTSGCSAYSAVASTTVTSPPPAVPAVPTLTAPGSVPAASSYQISWSASSGATSYVAERSRNGGAYTVVYDGAGTTVSLTTGIAGSSNTHRVKACNATGCSAYSAVVTTSTGPRETTCGPGTGTMCP